MAGFQTSTEEKSVLLSPVPIFVVTILFLSPYACAQQVIFNNTSNSTNPVCCGYAVGLYPGSSNVFIDTYPFTVQGASFVLDEVGLLTSIDTAVGPTPNGLSLFVYADSGGKPGAVLESWRAIPVGSTITLQIAMSSTHPILQQGQQYWFGVTTTNPQETAIWWINPASAQSNGCDFINGALSLCATGGATGAFEILGSSIGNPGFIVSPSSLGFNVLVGSSGAIPQTINVNSSGAPITFIVSATSQGGNWLSVIGSIPVGVGSWQATTPASVSVFVDSAQLTTAGTYTGTITITSTGAINSPLSVPVTVNVGSPSSLVVSPTALSFSATAGSPPPPAQNFSVSVSPPNSSLPAAAAAVTQGGGWLSVSNAGSGLFAVTVNPAGLASGTYSGSIAVYVGGASNSPVAIPVILTVTGVIVSGVPSIDAVTNSAIPEIDYPVSTQPVYLAPRSMATIFGSNLASQTVSAPPPWPQSMWTPGFFDEAAAMRTKDRVQDDRFLRQTLGGVEVHLVNGPTFPCQGCDFVADLLYVSPTQINFVIPEVDGLAFNPSRIVLVRDGVVFDLWSCNAYGCPPGNIYVNSLYYDQAVFRVGYECLFSFSLSEPDACGVSWSSGPYRALLGAVTDLSGRLITSQNPVHQGQTITLWLTGLPGLTTDAATGLLDLTQPFVASFGVAQSGTDILSTVGFGYGWGNAYGPIGRFDTLALWAGESPEFVGLDQINLNFPTCSTNVTAAIESRYDAFMSFTSAETQAATTVRIYVPFIIGVGEPQCQW